MRVCTSLLSTSILLCTTTAIAHAQIHQDWANTFDAVPTGLDQIVAVAASSSGNVYAAGETGAHDVLLEKYDPAGNLAWTRTFDLSGGLDYAQALVIEPTTEAIYVVGRGDTSFTRGLVLKYDSAGTLLWSTTYNAPFGTAQFYSAALTPAGNLVAAAGLGQGGFALSEYDPQGNLLWTGTDLAGDYPASIAFDSNGDILVCGSYYGIGDLDLAGLTRFSASGAHLWTRIVTGGGSGYESASSIIVDASGASYMTGRLIDPVVGAEEALVKIDSTGSVVWTSTHQGTQTNPFYGDEGLHALAFAANGNIRAAGTCANLGSGRDLRVFEFTPAGQVVWRSSWNGPANLGENCIDLRVEADGTLTVLAQTQAGTGTYNPVVARWDPQGTFLGADIDDLSAVGTTILLAGGFGPDGARLFAGRSPTVQPTNTLVVQVREQSVSYCFGDGSSIPCPCANGSAAGEGRGCTNSFGDSARLTSSGLASLAGDTLSLTSAGELPAAPSLFLQGSGAGAPAPLADGILCLSGGLRRMFTHTAAGGSSSAPSGSDASFSARSTALGDPISAGSHRYYQVVYRDPTAGFCPPPSGSTSNLSSALSVLWVP